MKNQTKWTQQVDPQDKAWVNVTMRIPNGGMPTATYSGEAATDRIVRFCRGFLSGHDRAQREHTALAADELAELKSLRKRAATMPYAVTLRGWTFAMATRLDGETTTVTLSAYLAPVRSTTELDWRMLGQCAVAIGAPEKPVTPIEATPPEEPLVWRWTVRTNQN